MPRCGVADPAQGLARLRAAAADGRLDALCARHGLALLTVFGSAVREGAPARDLDVAVLPGASLDPVALVNDLVELTGVEAVDLARLDDAGAVLRERALVGCVALYECEPGRYAAAQLAAIAERVETDPGRRAELQLLAT